MERRFTSGSRQTPDPYDQYLEQNNYYRKHTARDASSLFRVISEQMYDTQVYHLDIRNKCVTYMRKYRQYFDSQVNGDFDEYLDKMSKPSTCGTMLELQAVSYMFQRSVVLYEPYNLGNYINKYHSYFSEVFRVFYTPETHFDSVYTTNYIEDAAKCQSICYEILYQKVFKLPDISFTVEQMLHSYNFDGIEFEAETNSDGYTTCIYWPDGRRVEIDLPQNTNCILENHKYCHFHFMNFPKFSEDLLRDIKNTTISESEKTVQLLRMKESFLPDKNVSCIRQLLRAGIVPFPYKVAKALDPNMYRNIEFDAWNEMRKQLRLKNWYNGDSNFKLGERRLVPYNALKPLPANQFQPWCLPFGLQRHIQKYNSIRFTRHCNYEYKFNNDWYRHHHQYHHQHKYKNASIYNGSNIFDNQSMKRNTCIKEITKTNIHQFTHLENFRPQPVQYCTMPLTTTNGKGFNDTGRSGSAGENLCVTSGPVASIEDTNNTAHRSEVSGSALPPPLNTQELNSNDKNHDNSTGGPEEGRGSSTELNREYEVEHRTDIMFNGGPLYPFPGYYPLHPYGLVDENLRYFDNGGSLHAPTPSPAAFLPFVNGFLPPPLYHIYNGLGNPHMATPSHIHGPAAGAAAAATLHPFPLLPSHHTAALASPLLPTPNNAAIPPTIPTDIVPNACSNSSVSTTVATVVSSGTTTIGGGRQAINRNSTISTRINFDAKKSIKLNGADLPSDVATLRYFYNLGLDYYHKNFKRNITKISEGVGCSANDSQGQFTANKFSRNVPVYNNSDKRNVNYNQFEWNKIAAKNNVRPSQFNVRQSMDNSISNSHCHNQSNINNKCSQRRFNLRYYRREQQQQQSAVTSSTQNNNDGPNNQSNNSSSIRISQGVVNAKYPTTTVAAEVAAGAAGVTTKPETADYKDSTHNAAPGHPQRHANDEAISSMQMNNNVVQMQTGRTPTINSSAYMAPRYNSDGIFDAGNSRPNPYMWNGNGGYCGAVGNDGGNCDYNCENMLAASIFNGNLASYAATAHGLYVPMPITGQIPSYQIPLPSAAANMNVGIHSITVNGGNGSGGGSVGGGNGPGGGGNGGICHDHFIPNPFVPVNSLPTCTSTGTETHKGPYITPGGVAVNMLASQCNYHAMPIYYTDTNASMQQSAATATAAAINSHPNHSQNYWNVPPATSSAPSSPVSVGLQYKTNRNDNNNINQGQQQQQHHQHQQHQICNTGATSGTAAMNCIRNQMQQTNSQGNNSDVVTNAPQISANFNDKVSNVRD